MGMETKVRELKKICNSFYPNLHKYFAHYFNELYGKDNVYSELGSFIYAKGTLPILLVAHMDTVFLPEYDHKEFFYDPKKNVMWSPYGAGFDDRAGCYAIKEIIENRIDLPDILLTTEEEYGGLGAQVFTSLALPHFDKRQYHADIPINHWKYIIELDRQGHSDCVFYRLTNKDFKSYIYSYGFFEEEGSFTDISFVAPPLNVAAVNLSIGYVDEHTCCERLYLSWMNETIMKVGEMLDNWEAAPYFSYL